MSSSCCQARLQRFMTLWRVPFRHTRISGPCSNDSIGVPQEQKVQSILYGIPEENKHKRLRLQKASTLNRFSSSESKRLSPYILHQSLSWLLDATGLAGLLRGRQVDRKVPKMHIAIFVLSKLGIAIDIEKSSKGTCRTSLSWTFGRSCRFRTLHQVEQQPSFLAHDCSRPTTLVSVRRN